MHKLSVILRNPLARLCAGFSLLVAPAAFAQSEDAITLDKLVVTGTYLPYAADATAVPVKVITTDDIQASGEIGDLLEVIRKTMPQFFGSSNIGAANASIVAGDTNGGSQLKLRNVQTLVLINGRRAAFAPASATGGFTFVDVNAIPVSAVERIEVLSDGASATYGSDAVSGVVNVILKKDFQGSEIGGGYRFATQRGNWEERSAHYVTGLSLGKFAVTLSADWVKSDPLFGDQRDFSFDQTGKSQFFPGVVSLYPGFLGTFAGDVLLNPALNAPPTNVDLPGETLVANGTYTGPIADIRSRFNLSPYVTLALGSERKAFTVMFEGEIAKQVHVFGDVLLANTKTFSQLPAAPIVGMPIGAAHVSDFGIGFTDPDHPHNPFDDYVFVGNRFVDYPRGYYNNSDSVRWLTGLRGEISPTLSYETAVNLNRVRQKYRNTNVINRAALATAIDADKINLFAYEQPAGALENSGVFATATSANESTLIGWDGRIMGELPWVVADAPLAYALGAEYRKESLSANPDAGSYAITDVASSLFGSPTSWDGATTSDPFDRSRTVKSLFTEVRMPLVSSKQNRRGIHELELTVAARYDRYSDAENPLVPKVQIRYLPVSDEFALRASYSESFTAPALFALFGPTKVGFTDVVKNLQRAGGGTIADAGSAYLRQVANPQLDPEKAKTFSAGFIFSPRSLKGLSVEANYFNIHQRGAINTADSVKILQDVETLGAASKYADRVKVGGFNGTAISAPGTVSSTYDTFGAIWPLFVTNYSDNFASARQDGVDVAIDYVTPINGLGKLDVGLNGMWLNRYTVEGDDYVGTTNGRTALNGGTIPRWLANLNGSFERNHWLVGGTVAYIPGVRDTAAVPAAPVDSFTRVDVFGRYRFSGMSGAWKSLNQLTLQIGANNLFNKMPPRAPSAWTDANADSATYGALGRVLYVNASYKF